MGYILHSIRVIQKSTILEINLPDEEEILSSKGCKTMSNKLPSVTTVYLDS